MRLGYKLSYIEQPSLKNSGTKMIFFVSNSLFNLFEKPNGTVDFKIIFPLGFTLRIFDTVCSISYVLKLPIFSS
ncbi:Uncharacterised protein [Streptococcus pneumoniae]|nr:Uncharacterised protein [Streptococcus pneumoniae]